MSIATAPVLSRLGEVRPVLRLDAVASGAVGVLLLGLGWMLDDALGTPLELTLPAGAFLLVWATALGIAFVLAQAIVVAGFAALQLRASLTIPS